jgi:hypothetical protein
MTPQLPPRDTLDDLFPGVTKPPAPGTFELGLVLGGTVSAGAYTAGALDLLVQALDAWHARATPPHKVSLTVAGGSSGGAVCAALLAVLANRSFPHVTQPAADVAGGGFEIDNKFWNTWVDRFAIARLLDTGDLQSIIDEGTGDADDNKQHVPSIFNCQMIDAVQHDIATYADSDGNRTERAWVAKPLRVAVTVGNLRGVPYRLEAIHSAAAGYTGAAFVQHDDFAWFAVPCWQSRPEDADAHKRPNEFWVEDVGYGTLAAWAAASGAMPLGLAARPLTRPLEHYVYRPNVRAVMDAASGTVIAATEWPQPDWSEIEEADTSEPYAFTAVDGGTFNNDPVTLVHRAIAGLIGQNPRDPETATRAMLMIDPLADQPTTVARVGRSLLAVAKVMTGSFVGAARYLTADMDLFADENVFSRFQLVPNRDVAGEQRVGERALAGTGMFAMAGWCVRDFRVHDFLLGRANMFDYLNRKFILRGDNTLFDGWQGSPDLIKTFAVTQDGSPFTVTDAAKRSAYFLPVIPADDEIRPAVPDWPCGKLDPDTIKDGLAKRVRAVLSRLREDNLAGIGPALLAALAGSAIADAIVEVIVTSLKSDLVGNGLWPAPKAGARMAATGVVGSEGERGGQG